MLNFRLSSRRAVGHGVDLSLLATGDTLIFSLCRAIVVKCDQTRPFGPPAYRSPSPAVLAYLDRKKAAIRASYFRQRYGRDYWTGLPARERISPAFSAAFKCGYQDELSGAPSTSSPRVHTTGRAFAYYERGRREGLAAVLENRA